MLRIDADLLVPGTGEPVPTGTVLLDGDTIAYAGPTAAAPQTPDADVVTAPTVMPGMWDCHGHLTGMRSADTMDLVFVPEALRAARGVTDLRLALDAGFTSVREVGGMALAVAPGIEDGTVAGPWLYGAGSILSTTGGHGDLHSLPETWMCDVASWKGFFHVADGVPECIKAVRSQLRRGARVIKVCASGGVISDVDHPIHQQFRHDELRAMVETAAMADRVVAAHCHGKPGIMAALETGVHTIEHGSYLDEESCDAMVETGAVLVPTRFVVDRLVAAGRSSGINPGHLAKLVALADRHAEAITMAIEKGVTIAAGTDAIMSGADLPAGWGHHGLELSLLVDLGMTPLQAIEAATANGPRTLGPQAPRSGVLAAGYDADVITVDGDPTVDIGVLADRANVRGVWQAGRRVKG